MTTNDDTTEINEALQGAWSAGRCIDDALARRIACRLAEDAGPLEEFATTGAISADLEVALATRSGDDSSPLSIWTAALDHYCRHHGRRGPVAGWNGRSKE